MADQFLGQISMMAFSFPPSGWVQCNGQLMQIAQNSALFALLGTIYGGDGITNFNLPNLQGRVPISFSQTIVQGQPAGEATHALTVGEIPGHTHAAMAANAAGDNVSPVDRSWGQQTTAHAYAASAAPGTAATMPGTVASAGQAHENMSPYLVVNFCIAVTGIFPSRN